MKYVSLAEVADFNPRPNRAQIIAEQPVSFVAMADVSETEQRIVKEEERPASEVLKGYTYFERDDMLVAKITPCFENGKLAVAEIQHAVGFGSTEFHVIRPDRNTLDIRYLYHFLRRPAVRVKGETKMKGSAGQKRVPTFFLERLQIPLPPLDEQRHIAAVLDRADALRAKRRRAQATLDDLLCSAFVEMFGDPVKNPKGWPVTALGEVGHAQLGKMLSKKAKQGINPVPYLANASVRWRAFDLSDLSTMDFSEKELKKFDLRYGDLLICEGGEVGRCAIWRDNLDECSFQKAIHRLRLDPEQALPEYVQEYFYWMAANGGLADSTSQATIAHLTGVKLKKLPLPLPPIRLQYRFKEMYDRLIQAQEHYQAGQQYIDNLYHALAQRAFRGELTEPELAV